METKKQSSFMKKFVVAEPASFLEQILLPFVIAAISMVIISYLTPPPLDFKVSTLNVLRFFGCGFGMAYSYAIIRNKDRCILTGILKSILFLISVVYLTISGMLVWQLTLIWVI